MLSFCEPGSKGVWYMMLHQHHSLSKGHTDKGLNRLQQHLPGMRAARGWWKPPWSCPGRECSLVACPLIVWCALRDRQYWLYCKVQGVGLGRLVCRLGCWNPRGSQVHFQRVATITDCTADFNGDGDLHTCTYMHACTHSHTQAHTHTHTQKIKLSL